MGLNPPLNAYLSPPPLLQNELPEELSKASNTIAWWQSRQAEVQARRSERRAAAPSPKPVEEVGPPAGSL